MLLQLTLLLYTNNNADEIKKPMKRIKELPNSGNLKRRNMPNIYLLLRLVEKNHIIYKQLIIF